MAEEQKFDIPKTCKAGVVKNEGPDFYVEVEDVPVPEIGNAIQLLTLAYPSLPQLPPAASVVSKVLVANMMFYLPGPEDVLLKINATGLCLSDIHFMMNDWAVPKMSELGTKCPGHEGAGVIVKVGERVKNLKVGQRAGFKPILDVCHVCDQCKMGRETYCAKAVLTGLHCDGKSYHSGVGTSSS